MNRRQFFALTGGGAVSTLLGAESGMFVTMRTLSGFWVAGAPPWNVEWRDFIKLAAKVGYQGVDLLPLPSLLKDKPETVSGALKDLGLRVGFLSCPASLGATDEAGFRTSMARLDEVCSYASAIGCRTLVTTLMSSSDTPAEEWRKITLDHAHVMERILEKYKVRVAIENLAPLHFAKRFRYPFIRTVPEVVAFCKDAGPSFGLCLDSWHWHHSGGTVQDIVAAGKSQILMAHLDDAAKQKPEEVQDSQRVIPGEGVVNLTGYLQALKQIGFDGPLSPEPLGWFPKETAPEEVAKKTYDATISVMKKAGLST